MATHTDTFTDTNLTLIYAHTEGGYTWTKHAVKTPSSDSWIINPPGRVRPRSNVGLWAINGFTPAGADYDVSVDAVLLTDEVSTAGVGVVGRAAAVAATGYVFRFRNEADIYELVRVVTGTETVLSSAASGAFAVETRTLKLEMRGTAIKGYVNGAEVCSATDANIAAAGSAGIEERGSAGAATHVHWDNFVVADAAGGGGSTAAPKAAYYRRLRAR